MVFTTAAARATRASKKTGEGLAEFYSQFYLASTLINILCVLCFCFAHSVLENISQYLCWRASFHQRIMSEAAASSVRKKPASQLAKEAITLRTHYHLPGLERKVSTTRKLLPAKRCIEQNTPVEPAPEPKAKPQPKKTLPRKKAVVSVSGGSEPQRAEGSGSTGEGSGSTGSV